MKPITLLLRYGTNADIAEIKAKEIYDFFDSDGLEKSIGGTIAKTAFKIAPYFIPYVNYA